jgi:hypothetical protein
MQMLKLTAIAAALVAASMSASAMTTIADEDLSAVAGQDGVSIAANLNINIGSFTYTENNGVSTGGVASVGFNNIQITGLLAMTVDVVSQTTFSALYQGMTGQTVVATQTTSPTTGAVTQTAGTSTLSATATAAGYALGTVHSAAEAGILAAQGLATATGPGTATLNDQTSAFYSGGDVVQFAFPNVSAKAGTLVDIKVGGITMGVNGVQASSGAPSFGSFALNQLDLRGTTVWMWAH